MTEPTKPADIRMRGFTRRSTVQTAWSWVDEASDRRECEQVELSAVATRVLAQPLVAPMSVPPFARSAMDGYALLAEETTGASDYSPLTFDVVGRSMPGDAFADAVGTGQAVRIMTGAPLPVGATGVVPVEYARETDGRVEITLPLPVGKHVGRIGEDIAEGATVLPAGRVLRPQDLGVAASLGVAQLNVLKRPRVRIVTTGNELAIPGQERDEFQIYDANTAMLSALVERDGAELESIVRAEDTEAAIERAMICDDVDVVIVGGGSSVGAEDFAPQVLARAGELAIHGVAMRPSSPSGMGRIGETLVFLLPGNPVSCLCAYDFFAGRSIRQLGGRGADWPYVSESVELGRKITSVVGRLDYCRVAIDSQGRCEPIAISGASILSSTTRADGFVVVPAESEGAPEGSEVTLYRYASV